MQYGVVWRCENAFGGCLRRSLREVWNGLRKRPRGCDVKRSISCRIIDRHEASAEGSPERDFAARYDPLLRPAREDLAEGDPRREPKPGPVTGALRPTLVLGSLSQLAVDNWRLTPFSELPYIPAASTRVPKPDCPTSTKEPFFE